MTTSEIFAKNQILTLAKAKELKGKKITCSSPEYHMNTPHVSEFVVGEIVSSWDNAAVEKFPLVSKKYVQHDNYQQCWESYMTESQIDEEKKTLILFSEDRKKRFNCHTELNFFKEPTFTGSDADREVYYIETTDCSKSDN